MRTFLTKCALLCFTAWLGASAFVPRASAQIPVGLQIQLYAGLNITGTVGSLHAIQYATNLDSPDWRCLAIVHLTNSPHLYTDSSVPAREQRFYRAVKGLPNLAWIPPGSFVMGSPATEVGRQSNEGPQTFVTLTRGFYMGRYEVTQAEYLTVKGSNPSAFPTNLTLPVEMVSWQDAVDYCAKLTQRELGLGQLPQGWAFRLPTEAEWEYACRSGTTTRFSHGDDTNNTQLVQYAWYGDPDAGRTHPVGTKLPNAWGLYDMHGNVWELCQDVMIYRGGSVINPTPAAGPERMSRGGSWHSFAPRCRSASRNPYTTTGREAWVGFRVVLAPVSP